MSYTYGTSLHSHRSSLKSDTDCEMFLRPFQDALRAGAGNIMCSYNRVNNSYACSNSKTLNGLLKTELGFQVCTLPYTGAYSDLAGFCGFRLGSTARGGSYSLGWS
jgi:beta-glucosidase-like glycosyl hydrolase